MEDIETTPGAKTCGVRPGGTWPRYALLDVAMLAVEFCCAVADAEGSIVLVTVGGNGVNVAGTDRELDEVRGVADDKTCVAVGILGVFDWISVGDALADDLQPTVSSARTNRTTLREEGRFFISGNLFYPTLAAVN